MSCSCTTSAFSAALPQPPTRGMANRTTMTRAMLALDEIERRLPAHGPKVLLIIRVPPRRNRVSSTLALTWAPVGPDRPQLYSVKAVEKSGGLHETERFRATVFRDVLCLQAR